MRDLYAARAARAYTAMQRSFQTRPSGLYRRDGWLRLTGGASHLWPFSRALVATLDICGVGDGLVAEIDADAAIGDRLTALERYWDPDRHPPAYSSDVLGSRIGGDRYYDDNAWVGLGLVQLERMRPGGGHLDRAEDLFRFALGGWASDREPQPGGVYWVEQERGLGLRNHDRNTVSTAPNAELGLHIAELRGSRETIADPPGGPPGVGPPEMYAWVLAALDESAGSAAPGTGLFWDKIRGDATIDRALWSYNQGSMVGAGVLLARAANGAGAGYLRQAEAIAAKALRRYADSYKLQPAAFNAIFFRNLLLLHAATSDGSLRDEIVDAMRGYADWAWGEARDRRDRFRLPNGGVTLLNQSAIVQVLALLAWDPLRYTLLA
jgi:Glycosyl hydrolase family 76